MFFKKNTNKNMPYFLSRLLLWQHNFCSVREQAALAVSCTLPHGIIVYAKKPPWILRSVVWHPAGRSYIFKNTFLFLQITHRTAMPARMPCGSNALFLAKWVLITVSLRETHPFPDKRQKLPTVLQCAAADCTSPHVPF